MVFLGTFSKIMRLVSACKSTGDCNWFGGSSACSPHDTKYSEEFKGERAKSFEEKKIDTKFSACDAMRRRADKRAKSG